tara:strand:+ start:1537 stop:1743 length:207 start_codon:yes stop_codon:yes gene_type:complete
MRGLAQKSFESVSRHVKQNSGAYVCLLGMGVIPALFTFWLWSNIDESKLHPHNNEQNGQMIWPIPGLR